MSSGWTRPEASRSASPMTSPSRTGWPFRPTRRVLYVADSAASHDAGAAPPYPRLRRGGRAAAQRPGLCPYRRGIPDGIRTDSAGNLWSSAADGVHCFAPDGSLLGKILVPETVSNLTFGGPRRNRLFITATTSLYAIYVTASGAQRP